MIIAPWAFFHSSSMALGHTFHIRLLWIALIFCYSIQNKARQAKLLYLGPERHPSHVFVCSLKWVEVNPIFTGSRGGTLCLFSE